MNLWIITVNFGDTVATESLIDSVATVKNIPSVKVAIVDNAASSHSTSRLNKIINKSILDIIIISNKKNLFYWPAIKKAINKLKDKFESYPDWIIVCNNDIIFSDKDFFKNLDRINIKKYPIVGPNIINSSGKKLNPFMASPLSKLQSIYWKLYFFSYPLSRFLLIIKKLFTFRFLLIKSEKIKNNKQVYAVHGSAILFSNHFFISGGWLDSNFQMYGEELTVAEIAKKINLPVTYCPKLKVTHYEHSTTKKINNRILFYKAKQFHKYFQSAFNK
tara:strand:+ start:1408 stop:2232 length:825 start_codon:yes stop_codon:yes gene_type:complete